jgi:hypothetical protein
MSNVQIGQINNYVAVGARAKSSSSIFEQLEILSHTHLENALDITYLIEKVGKCLKIQSIFKRQTWYRIVKRVSYVNLIACLDRRGVNSVE